MLRPDAATLRAVEAAALNRCAGLSYPKCTEACRLCVERMALSIAAYHAALGETVRVTRVERCAMDGKEEG